VGASSHQGTIGRGDDVVTGFSSRGPTWVDFDLKPDLVAPGLGIESLADPLSALYRLQTGSLLQGTRPLPYYPYMSLSGTSMSAPVVAGTVALMLEASPRLTPNAVKALLQYTAQLLPDTHPFAQGAGLLNARGAVRMARFFANPTRTVGAPEDRIDGATVRWARHILWANRRLVGGVPLPGSNAWRAAWGSRQTPTGDPIVWGVHDDGDNIVWSTDDADNIVWSTNGDDNIVWSTNGDENIVWSTTDTDNIVWSTNGDENIVWSTGGDENIVWSTDGDENIVWSTDGEDNIVWSTDGDENIVWSTNGDENIVWSTNSDDNIVWSTGGDENIVWSTGSTARILWPAASTPAVTSRDRFRRAGEVR
jgi:subtilisin family serine protease